jgi:hypothetical protein
MRHFGALLAGVAFTVAVITIDKGIGISSKLLTLAGVSPK